MKRLIFLLFILSLSCLVSVAREFSYTYEGQTLVYTVLDEDAKTCETKAGVLHIGTPGNKVSGILILPEKVMDGNTTYTLTRIGDFAFNGCTGLSGLLAIPNSVTSIGSRAFSYCSGLTGPLTIPNSVTSIGNEAFRGCSGLTGPLTIPNSVTSIGGEAFRGCSSFTGPLTIPDSVTSIGWGAFNGCSGFTGPLTITNSIISIERDTFSGCSGLTGPLTIPNSVTSIGDDAFEECSGFTGPLTIPNSVTSIGHGAFYSCSGLTGSLTIPNSLTTIEQFAFYECSGLNGQLTIPNSVTSIGWCAFKNCSGLTGTLTIPNSIISIGDEAFSNCIGFTESLTIGNSVTSIGRKAFKDCSGLTGPLTIPNSVTSIGHDAFAGCSGLTGPLNIPNSVTSIGKFAFAFCSGLTGPLTIPNSLTTIEQSTFDDCSGLTGPLTIPNSVTLIGDNAFFGCSGLTGPLTIPNSVTSIGLGAFYFCNGLTGPLTIPNSVTSIGGAAFTYCSGLTGPLTIPNSVTSIGCNAFEDCSGLTGPLTISESVTSIYAGTFKGCKGLTGSLIIPNSVTSIGAEAFLGCIGFTDLYLPENLKKIERGAFAKNIERVYCEAQNPPIIGYEYGGGDYIDSAFSSYNATLIVPTECIELYKTAPLWRFFYNIRGDKEVEVISIELDKTTVSLKATETVQLTATVLPETTTDKSVSWTSSDSEIATVDTEGLVTAISVGTATITATSSNGLTATCAVEVIATPAGSIELNKTTASLKATETVQLTATVLPEDATDRSVTWSSSDTSVVSVDETGLVTAMNVGSAVVTATTGNGLSAECLVEVIETPASEVIIDKESLGIIGDDLEMRVGEVRTINVSVLPETATDKSVDFESSDPTVASVDSDGILRALSLGNTTVTVTAKSGVSASINVIVVATPVETVTLNRTEASLKVSEQLQLTATVLPEDATDRSVTWSSSDSSIVSVDETGLVTAINVGSAVVTATTGNGLSAECLVEVTETPASEIIIDKESLGISGDDLEMIVGEVRTINVTVLPETATDKSVVYYTSNPEVASIDARGVLTALTSGITTMTVTARSGISSSINVIVKNPPVNTVDTYVSPSKVREGSEVSVAAGQPLGGYGSGWEWNWSMDGVEVSSDLEFDFRPMLRPGLEREIENIRFDFRAVNRNPEGIIISQINAKTESVSVYRRPQTPLQLLRKGDGSSHTLVVMAGIDDQKLDDLGYTFVYGYTDRHGIDHVMETTRLRYCRTLDILYNDPDIKLWVYSVWKYDDGSVVTSGRRYLDGYADDDFDASVFDGRGIRPVASHNPDTWIRPIGNGVEINMISDLDSRIDIYDMHGRVVRSRSVKGGVTYLETFVFDKADGNVFVVKASSGNESVVRKIVIR